MADGRGSSLCPSAVTSTHGRARVFNTEIELDLDGLYIGFGKVHGCDPAEPDVVVVTECTFERCYSVNKVPRKDTRTKSLYL